MLAAGQGGALAPGPGVRVSPALPLLAMRSTIGEEYSVALVVKVSFATGYRNSNPGGSSMRSLVNRRVYPMLVCLAVLAPAASRASTACQNACTNAYYSCEDNCYSCQNKANAWYSSCTASCNYYACYSACYYEYQQMLSWCSPPNPACYNSCTQAYNACFNSCPPPPHVCEPPGTQASCGACGVMTCQSDFNWGTCQNETGVCTPGTWGGSQGPCQLYCNDYCQWQCGNGY
jgi:hypothetical protein